MVYKIVNNRFRVLIESFLVALIIFLIGFSIGFYIENFRTSQLIKDYNADELQALDLKLQNYYYQIMDQGSCKFALEQNLIFADKIYEEGLKIEKFEEADQISESVIIEKKKYVLLKTELWLNTIFLKNKCNTSFNTIVYLYSNDPKDTFKVSQQKMISNILKDLKEKYGNEIILLPIAGDLDLDIVSMQMKLYNVSNLPSLVINEKDVLDGFHSAEELEQYLK